MIAETLLMTFWVQAVALEEGNGRVDHAAYNRKEDARGAWQVRPIMCDEVERLTGHLYRHDRMHEPRYARGLVMAYFTAQRARGMEFHEIARRWNGSGEKASEYAYRVEARVLFMQADYLNRSPNMMRFVNANPAIMPGYGKVAKL